MNGALLEAFRHNSWATRQLLAFCRDLSEEQLAASATGTYGSIRATFNHLVLSDGRYLRRLAGGAPAWVDRPDDVLGQAREVAEQIRREVEQERAAVVQETDQVRESAMGCWTTWVGCTARSAGCWSGPASSGTRRWPPAAPPTRRQRPHRTATPRSAPSRRRWPRAPSGPPRCEPKPRSSTAWPGPVPCWWCLGCWRPTNLAGCDRCNGCRWASALSGDRSTW